MARRCPIQPRRGESGEAGSGRAGETLSALLPWLLFVGLVLALLWWAYRTPPQVGLSRVVPHGGFAGTRLPLEVRLTLHSRLPTRVVVQDAPPRAVVADVVPLLRFQVFGRLQQTFHTTLTPNRRGVYDWPGATLAWADPLGLFWRTRRLEVPTRLEVYPTTHGLTLPDLLRPLLSEGRLTRQLGLDDPISLRGAREYAPGDPPGRIHWRLSARQGGLMVRELERMADSSVTVYLDLNGTEVYLESAVRLAASLLREAGELELPVAVATSAGVTPTGRGSQELHAALLALAQAQSTQEPPRIPPTRAGGNLILLTQAAGPELVAQALRARAQASRVSIVALPEGFYLEPGEKPRRQWAGLPESVKELERLAGTLAGSGILVYVLRGNQSILRIAG